MGDAANAVGGLASGAKSVGSGLGGMLSSGFKSVTGPNGAEPDMANIQQGTTVEDVKNAQQGTQGSMQAQQALLQALQSQNGLGMQSAAGTNQSNLANQLAVANGVQAQDRAIQGLQGTAAMYHNIAQGGGPNPAQSMLNQATGQNVANQAALMAGQRGAGANVGLMARQAAQQGANTQQQAVGQGATMQANQQLNALAGLTGAQQAVGGLGSNLTNQQVAANQAYANQANQMAGQQIAQTSANTNAQLANQQQMQNALQGVNNSNVSSQGSVNSGNTELSKTHTGALGSITGGIMQGATSILGARGGMVHMADGGDPNDPFASMRTPAPQQSAPLMAQPNMTPAAQPNMSMAPAPGAQSGFGQYMNGATASNNFAEAENMAKNPEKKTPEFTGDSLQKGVASATSALGKKGKEAYKSSGEAPAGGGEAAAARGGLAKGGGPVAAKKQSQKAEKAGNSYANDKIPAMLSEGEVVIPRNIMETNNPGEAGKKFINTVLARRKK